MKQMPQEWEGFVGGHWTDEINVRDFIQKNYKPYDGDESFLAGPTAATKKLWEDVMELAKKEREAGGVLDMDNNVVSSLTSHGAGYIEKDLEQIVGLQTDKPFKRSFMPYGVSEWLRTHSSRTVILPIPRCTEFSANTERPITQAFLMYIPPR